MAGATRRHSATLLPGGRVLVLGGLDVDPGGAFLLPNNAARATAQLFDPATGRWSAAGGLAFPRADHGAALLGNGKVLVTGGSFNQLRYVQVNASMYQVYTDNHLISASELWK
jgi:hypothetical protein